MPLENLNQNKQVQNIEITQEFYTQQQDEAWNVVKDFEETASVKTKQGAKKAKYDTMNIAQLRDQLLNDKDSKSESFKLMSSKVDRLLLLAPTKGFDANSLIQPTVPFFETFYQAKEAVNSYIFGHSGYLFSEKGERRMQIALRIKNLLNQMEVLIDEKLKTLGEKEARRLELKGQNYTDAQIKETEELIKANNMAADINKIIETGQLKAEVPAEEVKKSADTWIAKDYSQYLSKLVEGKKLDTKDDKNDFLAFMENQNNRLVANRIAIPMILDRKKDITLGMPWLRDELEKQIIDEVTEKDLFSKPEDFIKKADQICENFKTKNAELIAGYKEKRDKICKKLQIPADFKNLYKYASMEVMITNDEPMVFEAILAAQESQAKETDKLIEERLEKKFSAATRGKIKEKLLANLGPLRAFENQEQVMAQVDIFFEMLPYVAPEEYRVERQLSQLMDSLKIEEIYRDAFLSKMTNNSPDLFATKDNKYWKKKHKKTAEDIRSNLEEGRKLMEKKKLFLSEQQWEELDKKMASSCAMKKSDFLKALKAIIARPAGFKPLSLREYRERRFYSDSQNLPVQQRKVREEKQKLENIGHKLDNKFLVHLAGDGKNIYLPYRALNAAYKNTKGELKEQEKLENERFEARKKDLAIALWGRGIPETELDRYAEKFRWFMSGIIDITDDMSESLRLRVQRRNIERFGVKDWNEAFDKIKQLGDDLKDVDNASKVKEAKKSYDEGVKVLESYGEEKYKELIPFIINIPEVYAELLKGPESFKNYLFTLDIKLADFMAGCKKAGKKGDKKGNYISGVARKQYAHMYLRNIFDGNLKGDAAFFAEQLTVFQDKLFRVTPAGGISVVDAIDRASNLLDDLIKKDKYTGSKAILLKNVVMQKPYAMVNDDISFGFLTNKDMLEAMITAEYHKRRVEITADEKKTEIEAAITNEFKDKVVADPPEEKKAKEKIKAQKEKGITERLKFLKFNDHVLEEVRQGKTLIRVDQNGAKPITLDKSRLDSMKEKVNEYCDELDLPQVLKDALVEKGATGGIFPELTGTYVFKGTLYKHAMAMRRMYDLLRRSRVNDPGMSDEEALMFIVRLYRDPEQVKDFFDEPKNLSIEELRNTEGYKAFRSTYKKLKDFEEKESKDPSLDQEIQAISTNLRTMLMTGLGVRDENGKTLDHSKTNDYDVAKRVESIIDDSKRYVDYWNKVMEVIRPGFMEIFKNSADPAMKKEFNLPEHHFDRKMLALRQYFMPDVIKELNDKNDFDEKLWKEKLKEFEKKEFRKYLESDSLQVTQKETQVAEQTSLERQKTDEKALSNLIDKNLYVFKGKFNKYKALDEEQKQLFAVGLMFLDKGATGYDTEGTMVLAKAEKSRKKQTDKITAEIQNYVEGKEYHFNIDYREAVNKLIDYGVTSYGTTEYAMDEVAFDKALRFARTISAKKRAFGQKDMERISDSYTSVYTASTKFNKPQLPMVDALRGKSLSALSVRDRLLDFVKDDVKATSTLVTDALLTSAKKVYTGPLAVLKGAAKYDKTATFNNTLKKYMDRLQKMNEGDLRILVHILQKRTLLDVSCVQKESGAELHVEQEERNALLEALSGDADVSAEVLKDTDNSEACFKAITTALSFQLRDDKNFAGKDITRDCFENKSFNRKTIVDWDLLGRAFSFLDEIKERRATVKALKNSPSLIKYSGNKPAIEAHKELQDSFANKNDFKQINFEEKIKSQADKDNENGDREDISSALAGYYALTEQQKVLFFKALCNRDILDISKKDYCKNFMGIKERNYVNQIGRDKLIDQFIDANREDNIGLKLEEGEYYRAMEMLFTTQISDRIKLSKEKDLSKIFSYERNFIMRRSTAIDWKLFKRALNFVNRASEELEMTEGNALLYRGAGDLQKNGHLNMNYGFLRKNFHRTGNQWARKLFIFGGKITKDKTKAVSDTLGKIEKGLKAADDVTKIVGFSKDGTVRNGIQNLRDKTAYFNKESKAFNGKYQNEKYEQYKKLTDKIDSFINKNGSAEELVDKLSKYYDAVFDGNGNPENQQLLPESNDLVEKEIKGTKTDKKKDDIRDTLNNTVEKAKKIEKTVPKVEKIVKKIGPEKLSDLIDLVDYTMQKAAYKFFDEKVANVSVEKNGDKQKYLEDLKKAADEYVTRVYEETLNEMVGEESAEKITELSNKFFDYKKRASNYIDSTLRGITYVKSVSDNVMNIASCASNIRTLNVVKDESKSFKEEDKKKLDKAKDRGRLDEAQKAKAKKAADKNQGLADTAASITKAMQGIGIADNVIKTATDTARFIGLGLGIGSEAIINAVEAGLEFAMFAIRVLADRNALKDYFVHTDAGKLEVEKIKNGYQASGNTALYDRFNKVSDPKTADTNVIDMISDAKGYEHTSELVENTGMSMAQSIVFSASEYNPMAESKLMAVTVMSVMGLEKLIGDTSMDTVEKLFNAFAMKR
ncbi:MAG: hypothetical protein II842_19695 [Butyrivibrio sp.]|nr:hypothetical protein [Butyrivibrio sp.]